MNWKCPVCGNPENLDESLRCTCDHEIKADEIERFRVEPDVISADSKSWFHSVCKSILTFLLILFLGASIIPLDNDIKTKFVFFVAICVATTFLCFQFPKVLSVQRMSLLTTVTAIVAGATLPALSLLAPVNTKYLENFTSLTFSQQAAYVVFAWALFPVAEEIYFRGLLFPVTAGRMGYSAGAILSVLLFVLYHMRTSGLAGLAVQGAIYTWLRYRNNSVSPSMLAHSVHNCSLLLIANLRS